jgi:bile acid:Na+ symporter, BASS family
MQELFSSVLLPANIALIMFGMGLSLKKDDFKVLWNNPKVVIAGLTIHMLILPTIAFIISYFLPINPVFKVGLVLIAACPGGTVSNLVTYWLKGNIALCITLTTMTSFLIIVTLPLFVNIALHTFTHQDFSGLHLSLKQTFFNVSLIILLPAYLGTLFRKLFRRLASKIEKPLEAIMTILLGIIYTGIIIIQKKEGNASLDYYLPLFGVTFLLNVLSMFGAYFLSRWLKFSNSNSYTISTQVGLQDSALAIFVASTLMHSTNIAIVAVVYGSFTFFSTFLFGYLAKKYGETIISDK